MNHPAHRQPSASPEVDAIVDAIDDTRGGRDVGWADFLHETELQKNCTKDESAAPYDDGRRADS